MSNKTKAIFNWSGGKDSSLALHKVLQGGEYEVTSLFTSISEAFQRISQHGVRVELLETQAESLGIPLRKLMMPESPDMDTYDSLLRSILLDYKKDGIRTSIFGDIFLEDLRAYRENRLEEVGFNALFPLWKIPSESLAKEFIGLGFKAILVCIDAKHLNATFAGREFDLALLNDLPASVDPCGEYGEFHTFVYDGPIFSKPVPFTKGETVFRKYEPKEGSSPITTGFWFCDLVPKIAAGKA